MPSRALFPEFNGASNALYAGATVSLMAVDGNGGSTGVAIALYAALTGTDELPNPQKLTVDGTFPQPVYFAADCVMVVNKEGVASDYTSGVYQPGAAGGTVTAFTDLSDAPSSYTGKSLYLVRVNTGETALEFMAVSGLGIPADTTDLDDTPDSYGAGDKYKTLAINAAGTAFELVNMLGHPRPGYTPASGTSYDIVNLTTREHIVWTADLTQASSINLSDTGAIEGLHYRIIRKGGGAFDLTITGLTGATTQAMSKNQVVDVVYLDGAWEVVDVTFRTMARDFRDQIILNAYLQSHHEVAPSIASSSGALALDFDLAQVQLFTPTEAVTAVSYSNLQKGYSTVMLIFQRDADGDYAIATTAWPTGTLWLNNLVPDLTQLAAGQRARIMLWHIEGELDSSDNPIVYGSFELLYPAAA